MKDVVIIGAGPTGLFGAYYAGLRQMSVTIIDSLPDLGGQLTALYPEKYIYDMPGYAKVLAKDLVQEFVKQGMEYHPDIHLEEEAISLERLDDGWAIRTNKGNTFLGRTVIITAGVGAFSPRLLGAKNEEQFLGRGLWYGVRDPATFEVDHLIVVGGGDSAFDWALALHPKTKRTMLLHRRDVFVAHEDTVMQVQGSPVEIRTFWEIEELHGDGRLEAITAKHTKTEEVERLPADAVTVNIGFMADLGPLRQWGLEIKKNQIAVDWKRETNLPGVFAAGDVADYPGKLKLIATGVGDVCTAVCYAKTLVDPTAHAFPGHSTNMTPPPSE